VCVHITYTGTANWDYEAENSVQPSSQSLSGTQSWNEQFDLGLITTRGKKPIYSILNVEWLPAQSTLTATGKETDTDRGQVTFQCSAPLATAFSGIAASAPTLLQPDVSETGPVFNLAVTSAVLTGCGGGTGADGSLEAYLQNMNPIGQPEPPFTSAFKLDAQKFLATPTTETTPVSYSYKVTPPYPGGSATYTVAWKGTITASPAGGYVALGDSFSSGQMNPLIPGSLARCYRSQLAYPYLYDKNVIFEACSGATSAAIENEQVGPLTAVTRLVTLTAGGDDANLFGLLQTCVVYGFDASHCARAVNKALHSGLGGVVENNLVGLYHTIHDDASSAWIFVLGYPNPVPFIVEPSCSALHLAGLLGGLGLRDHDAELLGLLVDDVNHWVRIAIKRANSTFNANVTYVAPFSGHDVCSRDSWFWPLGAGAPLSLHPNAAGQRAMADALRLKAGAPPS